jgi:hypothetical protein
MYVKSGITSVASEQHICQTCCRCHHASTLTSAHMRAAGKLLAWCHILPPQEPPLSTAAVLASAPCPTLPPPPPTSTPATCQAAVAPAAPAGSKQCSGGSAPDSTGQCADGRPAQCPAGSMAEAPGSSSCGICPAGMSVVALVPQGPRACVQQCRTPLQNARCAAELSCSAIRWHHSIHLMAMAEPVAMSLRHAAVHHGACYACNVM